MNTFKASFRHEIISSLRSRSPQLIVIVFLVLTSLSSLIGWLTVRNVTKIYAKIVAEGLTRAPNPFTSVAPLYYMRNSVIYIVVVGALMAIVLGAQSSLRDRKSSAASLVSSRNVNFPMRTLGQICAIGVLLATLEIAVILSSIATMWLIEHRPLDPSSFFHLLAYGAISWLFMLSLACIGLMFGLVARSEESALLYPIVGWAVITFAIPQLITSIHPVALLNPTPAASPSSGLTQSLINLLSPLMLMEHFKSISNSLLSIDSTIKLSATSIASFAFFVLAAIVAASVLSSKSFGRELYE